MTVMIGVGYAFIASILGSMLSNVLFLHLILTLLLTSFMWKDLRRQQKEVTFRTILDSFSISYCAWLFSNSILTSTQMCSLFWPQLTAKKVLRHMYHVLCIHNPCRVIHIFQAKLTIIKIEEIPGYSELSWPPQVLCGVKWKYN